MRSRNARAFTLIEVLAALVIVSLGMLAVIQAVGQAVSNGSYLRDKTIAQWVAMNQLTLMRMGQSPPAKGTSSGEVEMAGQRWKWTAEVAQTPVDSMKRIDIAVRLGDADEKSQLTNITGFFGEKISKPGTLIAQYTPVPSSGGQNPSGAPQSPPQQVPQPPIQPQTPPQLPPNGTPVPPQQPLIQ